LIRFQRKPNAWESGQIEITDKYSDVLLSFYESAQVSVFSTSVPEYLETWSGAFGKQIIAAHQRSKVPVQRIFIFDNREAVDDKSVFIMRTHQDAGVDVRVLFKDRVPWLQNHVRDFTIIDGGEAIGITVAFTQNHLGARWHFKNGPTTAEYSRMRENMWKNSELLDNEFPPPAGVGSAIPKRSRNK
jgi:hypothetical protein